MKKFAVKKVSFACPIILLILAILFGAAFAVFQFSLFSFADDLLDKLPDIGIGYPIIAAAVAGLFLVLSIIAFCVQGAKKKKNESAKGIAFNLFESVFGVSVNKMTGKATKYYKKGVKDASGCYKGAANSVGRFMNDNPAATLGIVAAIPASIVASSWLCSKIAVRNALKKAKKPDKAEK